MNEMDNARILQEHGVRPTPQRLAVYDYLLNHRTHPSADTIYDELSPIYPSFSRTTIYNSLKVLMQAGLIRVVTIDPMEQHFDGDAADHGHCRCQCCGRLFDVALPPDLLDALIPDGFAVTQQDVFFVGKCKSCQQNTD